MKKMKKHLQFVRDIFENGLITDICPYFLARMFPRLSGLAWMTEVCAGLSEFLNNIIKEHKKELNLTNPRDFIDVYLVEASRGGDQFNTDELVNCIWDFFLAGTETSSTTLKWAVLLLTLHQDVQERWTFVSP